MCSGMQSMKRMMVLVALVLPLDLGACKKGHPISVDIAPEFQSAREGEGGRLSYEKVAVFPFLSALHHADDPDGIAPATMESYFLESLDTRTDYKFIAPNTVQYAIEQNGWDERYREFANNYPTSDEVDAGFLEALAGALQCDAFLIPVVDTWMKDEVDLLENASAATYVGATITIVDGRKTPGKVLFRAVDEDYVEGARSETADRTVVRQAGRVRSRQRGEGLRRARVPGCGPARGQRSGRESSAPLT